MQQFVPQQLKTFATREQRSDQRERTSTLRAVARIKGGHCRPRKKAAPAAPCRLLQVLAFFLVTLAVQGLSAAPAAEDLTNRQEILDSPRWAAAKAKFDQWLSVQTLYTEDQVWELESELRNQIASLSAEELTAFLAEMEAKLEILMSPASQDARRWANKFTPQGLQRRTEKYGVVDPIRMPTAELAEVLEEFTADRQAARTTSVAFERSRTRQMEAAQSYHQQQTKVAYRRKEAGTFTKGSSAYAPRQGSDVKVYPKRNIGIGIGWGW